MAAALAISFPDPPAFGFSLRGTRCWRHTRSSPGAAVCRAHGGACPQMNILLPFQSSPASPLGSGSCWTGGGRCWGGRLDSYCWFANYKPKSHLTVSPLHSLDSLGPKQVGALLVQKARQAVSTAQGGCSRDGERSHPAPKTPPPAQAGGRAGRSCALWGPSSGNAALPRSGSGHVLLTATPRVGFVPVQVNETNKQLGNMETMRAPASSAELYQASGFYLEEM